MNVQHLIPEIKFDSDLPPMDREQIDMLLMVDEEEDSGALVKELFQLFSHESEEKLSGLTAACESNNALELRKIVHFVAGSAGNLGLARMAGFYRALERALDNGELTDLSQCEEPIRREFEAGCRAFRDELNISLDD